MNQRPLSCEEMLREASTDVRTAIDRELTLGMASGVPKPYEMLRYFVGGKYTRPGLLMHIAGGYGVHKHALDAAVAIEYFHNFLLIHDDIEDGDAYRRGKETLWKRWGVNEAINAGDLLSMLAMRRVAQIPRSSPFGAVLSEMISKAFISVTEGQHMDLEFSNASIESKDISEAQYMIMIEKKTAALFRLAVEAGGVIAQKESDEIKHLGEYGFYLGMGYQMLDDYHSCWSSREETGKDVYGDLKQRKRTLPILYAFKKLQGERKDRLRALYALDRSLTETEIVEIRTLIDTTDARRYMRALVIEHFERAKEAVAALTLQEERRNILIALVDHYGAQAAL